MHEQFPRALATGLRYEVPKRRLSCADVSVAWLTLDPGKVTPPTKHPGSELIIPIKGDIKLQHITDAGEIKDICTLHSARDIVHFDSQFKHRVGNFTGETVELLLIRFLNLAVHRNSVQLGTALVSRRAAYRMEKAEVVRAYVAAMESAILKARGTVVPIIP